MPVRHETAPRRLGLVVTGGTIGAEHGSDHVVRLSSGVEKAELELLRQAGYGGGEVGIAVRHPLRRLSENMRPRDWLTIAEAVRDLSSDDVDGVLVLHGTDTASYTAAALSFLLADVAVPIVITGSNMPPDQEGTDAVKNIADALVALEHLGGGTYVSFAGSPGASSFVHYGPNVRKTRASGQAFYSINRPPVARVTDGRFIPIDLPRRRPAVAGRRLLRLDDRVFFFRIYPGCRLDVLGDMVTSAGVRGVVLEVYASGTGPEDVGAGSLPGFIERCEQAGIITVAVVPEAPRGDVNPYESGISLQKAGAMLSWSLLPETAIVKLMWALGQSSDRQAVRSLIEQSIAGETDLVPRSEPIGELRSFGQEE